MNFIKRAWYAVVRKPARTVILLVIFLVIANLVLTGLSIQHATSAAETAARKQLGATLTLSYDTQKALEQARSQAETSASSGSQQFGFNITREPITEAMAQKLATQKDVIGTNILVNTYAMAENFDPVQTSTSSSSASSSSKSSASSSVSTTATAADSTGTLTATALGTAGGAQLSTLVEKTAVTAAPESSSSSQDGNAGGQPADSSASTAQPGTQESKPDQTNQNGQNTQSSQNNGSNSRDAAGQNNWQDGNDQNGGAADQDGGVPDAGYGGGTAGSNGASGRTGSGYSRSGSGMPGAGGSFTVTFGQGMTIPDVTIVGLSSTALYADFNDGTSKLVSGRHIQPSDKGKNVAVIEQNLATQNSLKVGSKIVMTAPNSSKQVSYTVVGIYKTTSTSSSSAGGMRNMTYAEPYNYIYTDYQAALNIKSVISAEESSASSSSSPTSSTVTTSSVSSYATSSTTSTGRRISRGGSFGITSPGIDSVIYYLDDPKNMSLAETQMEKMSGVDWTKFTLSSDDAEYEQMVGTIQNVAKTSSLIVWLVGIVGAVILALIMLLNVRERMYETGVMLSMGESRLKLMAQFAVEMMMIAVVAFALSGVSGQYISKSFTNYLVQSELNSSASSSQAAGAAGGGQNAQYGGEGGGMAGGPRTQYLNRARSGSSNVKAITSLSVSISWYEFGGLFLIGMLIILLATIVPAVSIMRLKPKDILTRAG